MGVGNGRYVPVVGLVGRTNVEAHVPLLPFDPVSPRTPTFGGAPGLHRTPRLPVPGRLALPRLLEVYEESGEGMGTRGESNRTCRRGGTRRRPPQIPEAARTEVRPAGVPTVGRRRGRDADPVVGGVHGLLEEEEPPPVTDVLRLVEVVGQSVAVEGLPVVVRVGSTRGPLVGVGGTGRCLGEAGLSLRGRCRLRPESVTRVKYEWSGRRGRPGRADRY